MAVTANSFITPQTFNRGIVRFAGTTDGTLTPKTVYTAGTNGSNFYGLYASNGATAHNLSMLLINGGTTYVLNTISLTVSAGSNGTTPPIACMSIGNWPGLPVDASGNPFLFLASGDTLSAEYATAQGTADTITLNGMGADY